jgi:nucleotide-binding universal stress UspA family protein
LHSKVSTSSRQLRNVVSKNCSVTPVGSGEVAIVKGSGVEVIVQYAETVGAGLVVVGIHGRGGFERLPLGSTAVSVVERSPCSVLVVRLAAS